MPVLKRTHIEVYLFRRQGRRVEFLCLQRAAGRSLPGAWQPVTGKVKRGERALSAAVREVREETGLHPARWWALESVSIYFDVARDQLLALPMFAAEVPWNTRVRLSREHDAWDWRLPHAAGASFVWEAQRTGLAAVQREVLARTQLADALEVTPLVLAIAKRKRPRGVRSARATRNIKR